MKALSEAIWFPEVDQAGEEGLLAVGGDLSIKRLILAYRSGIFPWYSEGDPILWWSPDPRMVLFPGELRISKSFAKRLRKNEFRISWDTAFSEVIEHCAKIKRAGQQDTWITREMIDAYKALHKHGFAHSVEVWLESRLVGGLYGINLKEKRVFCGESMFSLEDDASKIAFYHLVSTLAGLDYKLIDCQVYTEHLSSLGAREIPREEFLMALE